MSELFLFNDFFDNDEDPGVEIIIPMQGRPVPFYIKRSMTIRERQKASDMALKKHFDPAGKLVIDGIDETVFTIEIVYAGLKSWPFVHKGNKPVEITRETIAKLPAECLDQLVAALMHIKSDQEEALVPFGKPSEDPS